MYLSAKEKETLAFLREYKTATAAQLKEFVHCSDRLLNKLTRHSMVKTDDDVYYLGHRPELAMISALEVLRYFIKDVDWHLRGTYPIYITFYMNGKTFDVTVVKPGEEGLISAAVNHIPQIERLIAVVEDTSSIPRITINVPVRYCTVNPVTFYTAQNGVVTKE
jgi:hypothetical protein